MAQTSFVGDSLCVGLRGGGADQCAATALQNDVIENVSWKRFASTRSLFKYNISDLSPKCLVLQKFIIQVVRSPITLSSRKSQFRSSRIPKRRSVKDS